MRYSVILPVLILTAATGCAPRAVASGEPAPVTVVVHNPTATTLPTQVCGASGCSAFRDIRPGGTARYRVSPGKVSRAVVTVRRGTRIANFPVDYTPGEVVHVALALP
ncbi:hypothetical protein [Longimicrobium sp.]|uniref:hypothetical protein n=1 Tax=Longimicrobium sp. TaxID=2029185 RepID=UPI002E33142E|nr:hypothetical protein [Longimicrobium sp.]HEX6036798.1 hypothetical protein [Longimicrobium sp.]